MTEQPTEVIESARRERPASPLRDSVLSQQFLYHGDTEVTEGARRERPSLRAASVFSVSPWFVRAVARSALGLEGR
jgi:hypothetical protein